MARFKIAGTDYVSEWGGSDVADGTNPNTPYASLSAILVGLTGRTVIVGAGVYKGNNYPNVARTFKADGKVIMDFLGGQSNASIGQYWEGFVLRNASVLRHGNPVVWVNNIFENVQSLTPSATVTLQNSILKPRLDGIPVHIGTHSYMTSSICLTSISASSGGNIYVGSYVSKNSIIFYQSTLAFSVSNFRNNCFNGIISRAGLNYELKLLWDGSPRPDADSGILDLVTIYPTCYTAGGNFACVDPQFIDIDSRTVLPTSPLLKRTESGTYIGAVKPAQIVRLDDSNFEFTYTNINTTNPLAVSTSVGQPYGQIRITGKISDSPVSFSTFSLRTILAYFKGAAGGSVENNNVPDAVRLLGLPAGDIDKPRRLTYMMRTSLSTAANQASAASVWDNDGAGAGNYLIMEDNTVPQHAPFGGTVYGNGDPRAIGAPLSSFNFCSIDIIVILDQERV